MATTSAAARQLSDLNSQGTILGRNSTDLISFYGATPVVRQTTATTAASLGFPATAQTASSGGFGASTAAVMTSTLALVSALQTDVATLYSSLKSYGLVP